MVILYLTSFKSLRCIGRTFSLENVNVFKPEKSFASIKSTIVESTSYVTKALDDSVVDSVTDSVADCVAASVTDSVAASIATESSPKPKLLTVSAAMTTRKTFNRALV